MDCNFPECHPQRRGGICCSQDRTFYVYFLASRSRVLYAGVTNDLARRAREHRLGEYGDFTRKYRVRRLVFFESFHDPRSAIAREKQIKRGVVRRR